MRLGLDRISSVAGSTTAQHQQTPRFKPCETGRKVERSEPFEKRLDLIEDAETYGVTRGALKRSADAKDMVGSALYLASDLAGFVTGQTLIVDGGRQFI